MIFRLIQVRIEGVYQIIHTGWACQGNKMDSWGHNLRKLHIFSSRVTLWHLKVPPNRWQGQTWRLSMSGSNWDENSPFPRLRFHLMEEVCICIHLYFYFLTVGLLQSHTWNETSKPGLFFHSPKVEVFQVWTNDVNRRVGRNSKEGMFDSLYTDGVILFVAQDVSKHITIIHSPSTKRFSIDG